MSLEDILQDKVLLTKLAWVGLIFSMFLMGIGFFVIAKDVFGL